MSIKVKIKKTNRIQNPKPQKYSINKIVANSCRNFSFYFLDKNNDKSNRPSILMRWNRVTNSMKNRNSTNKHKKPVLALAWFVLHIIIYPITYNILHKYHRYTVFRKLLELHFVSKGSWASRKCNCVANAQLHIVYSANGISCIY